MTHREALKYWRENIKPAISENDRVAMRESWGMYIDGLHRDGEITDKQYHEWDVPKESSYHE